MTTTIGNEGCACGDYLSDNLIATASCRKSGDLECSIGVVHQLNYKNINDEGLTELGAIIDRMFDYGGDGIVVVKDEELVVEITERD